MATQWGIISAGLISSDFVTALKLLPKDEHTIIAVGARDLDKAKSFAEKFGIPKFYSSYDEVIEDTDVDIVYIGVIHPHHFSVACKAINAGKPVLCEKPLCMNYKETKDLIDLARERNVFLMEAVWSRCFPVYKEMMNRIDEGEIGDIKQIIVSTGFAVSHIERCWKKDLGGGTTIDVALYCVQFILLLMKGQMPSRIVAVGQQNEEGTDDAVSASLAFDSGCLACLAATNKANLPNEGIVVGTKGTLKIEPVLHPTYLKSPKGEFASPLPLGSGSYNFSNSVGLMYEAAEVRRCLERGLLESPTMTLEETLTLSKVLEVIRKQVGVTYSQDD